jgi:hypothetical protein
MQCVKPINTQMKYWKYLDLNWRPASLRLREYALSRPEVLEPGSYFKLQDHADIVNHVPEVVEMLEPLKIDIRFIAFFVQLTNNCNIHVDQDSQYTRINIPILNCEHSETKFFTSSKGPVRALEASGVPYYYYEPEYCTCVSSYKLDGAILLRVREPHQVVIHGDHYPRISCSIGYKQDLTHLLDE